MWIYDGDEWINEGASETETKPENARQPEEMYYPELQVVEEIVPLPTPRTKYVPFPMV